MTVHAEARRTEGVRQVKCAIVVKVVADEEIVDRCLGGRTFERGVIINHPSRRVKARVTDSHYATASVVIRDIVDQPLDSVKRVRRLVNVCASLLVVYVWRHVAEHPL